MAILSDTINYYLGYGHWHDALTPEQESERNALAFRTLVQLAYEEGMYDKIETAVRILRTPAYLEDRSNKLLDAYVELKKSHRVLEIRLAHPGEIG